MGGYLLLYTAKVDIFFHIPTNGDKKIRYLDFIKIILHAISRHQLRYLYDDKIDIAYIGAVPPWTE